MAASELEAGSKLLYRNIDFNTYGFLNANEEFITQYPDLTATVLEAYERARAWILVDDAAQILAEEAKISTEVAERDSSNEPCSTWTRCRSETHAEVLRGHPHPGGRESGEAGDRRRSGTERAARTGDCGERRRRGRASRLIMGQESAAALT